LHERGLLPVAEVRHLLAQVCEGLAAAHQAGVVHGDLAPSRIVVDDRRLVKIVDFGPHKVWSMAGLAATGLLLGACQYMAPEQLRGRAADIRTDIYALGAIAYHVVTGSPPFGGDTAIAIGFAHLTQPVRAPRLIRPELPTTMDTAIVRALDKTPSERFPTVA